MKIKVTDKSYEEVMALPREEHRKPLKPSIFFRTLLKLLSAADLKATNFHCRRIGMERLEADEPCLFLMNHSSFIDLKIASTILYPRPFNIVCTSDGFVGKEWLMRHLGCIPTQKFVSDLGLVRDMVYTVKELHSSVLMYPEASYSFDGTATPLPESIGKCVKMLGVPLVMIRTYGAFARDPLYNGLQLRKVDVSADMEYLLSPQEIAKASTAEINALLAERFSFDNFRDQQEQQIRITEPFRADGLNRVLYKCPHCGKEGDMTGKGTTLTCNSCGKTYLLTETGFLEAQEGETEFSHIPDWYAWERENVRREILDGTYRLETDVDIAVMRDYKAIYQVGSGHLIHDCSGFTLTGCDGTLRYSQSPTASYGLYADYYWYELGDMVCIGNQDFLYYCFPKSPTPVAKPRLAAEELYKLCKGRRKALVKDTVG